MSYLKETLRSLLRQRKTAPGEKAKDIYTDQILSMLIEDAPDKNTEKNTWSGDIIKFDEYKPKIVKALEKIVSKNQAARINRHEICLIDGFFNYPIQEEIAGEIIIGGITVPMIALVDEKTGRMYFYALKILLPDIDI